MISLYIGFTCILWVGAFLLYFAGREHDQRTLLWTSRILAVLSPVLSVPFGYLVIHTMLLFLAIVFE